MSFALTVIGALVALLGVAAIGFGIPINEFSLGNTLIISGTTAVAGGLILVALAAALRQLTRIAEALTRQMPRPQRAGEPAEAAAPRAAPPPVPPRVPFPPKPPSREAAADMRVPEPPRPLGAPPMVAEDRTRPRFPPPPLNEDVAELDEPAPSSQQGAAPPVFPPAAAPAAAPSREPLTPSVRPETRSDEARAVGSAAVDVTRGPRLDPPWKPTLPAERETTGGPERTRGLFDSLWPVDRGRKDAEPRKADLTRDLGKADLPSPFPPRERREEEKATDLGMAAVSDALAKGLEPEPEAPAPEPVEARNEEPTVRAEPAPPPVEEPDEPAKPAEPPRSAEPAPAPAPRATPAAPTAGPADRAVTILKSGVVDGMAYTLYSDGSIEAELPEGTIRFTSIEDLRRHLDTHS